MPVAKWLITGAILLCLCTPAYGAGWRVEGRVVAASDGDTLTVLDSANTQHVIRIAGIDAPERKQPYGTASKDNVGRLVFKRAVEARCYKKDRYGREVCRVYESLRDVGLEQVRAGMAWHFKEYAHEQETQERLVYADEEQSARSSKRGLWKEPNPVPPWEWRRERRGK